MHTADFFFPNAGLPLLLSALSSVFGCCTGLYIPWLKFQHLCFDFFMYTFIYHVFFKFHFLSWAPEFFHRPVIIKNTMRASYSLGSGKPGAGSNPDAIHALANCFRSVGTEHGREPGDANIHQYPRQGEGWTRTGVQPEEEHKAEQAGESIHPSEGPSQRGDPSPSAIRQGWWSGVPGQGDECLCLSAFLMHKILPSSCLNSQIIFFFKLIPFNSTMMFQYVGTIFS